MHLGEAEERAGDYFGRVVNTAARVESAGHGGQVLLTESVRVAASVEAVDLGVHRLRQPLDESGGAENARERGRREHHVARVVASCASVGSSFCTASVGSSDQTTPLAGKLASMAGLEGGHQINGSLATLRMYYRLGCRYLTLTHNGGPGWADAALDENSKFNEHAKAGGLSRFGVEVVGGGTALLAAASFWCTSASPNLYGSSWLPTSKALPAQTADARTRQLLTLMSFEFREGRATTAKRLIKAKV